MKQRVSYWCCFGGVRNCAPRALHSLWTAWMSATRMFKKLLTRSGSGGASSVTVGLSSVGPPPTLMMIQLFEGQVRDGAAQAPVLALGRRAVP